jgi:hypothetical protein
VWVCAGAHNQYLETLVKGSLLGEEDFELQRELCLLLNALMRLLPQLRRLNFLVRCPGILGNLTAAKPFRSSYDTDDSTGCAILEAANL